jgi:nucleotide-binding universal stress UspA family protein
MYRAELIALAVRPAGMPPSLWLSRESAVPYEEPRGRERAEESLRTFVSSAAGTSVARTLVTDGRIVPEILRVARDVAADLLVMGTHGLGGFDRLILGSVTERVLRQVPCPVLTIPRRAPESPDTAHEGFRRVLCGADRSDASRRALDHAVSLARRSSGRLLLVHVLEDISAEEPRFASHFNMEECWRAIAPDIRSTYEAMVPEDVRREVALEVQVPFGKGARELLRAARAFDADLIVLGTAGWDAPCGATTQRVVREAECPVLTVPPPRAGAR